MSTIQLKTPEELYTIAPDLQIIAERLENSVKNAADENTRLKALKNKNRDTPGSHNNFKTRYPEHFRITEILKQGRWEKIPSELKCTREQFERDITSIATTRNPQAMKIEIFVGKRKITTPETFTVYLEESAKNTTQKPADLGNPEESDKLKELESKFVAISQANGNPNSIDLLKADFAMQIKNFTHQAEINELKRNHERDIEKKDKEIEKLCEELEELESDLLEAESENLGSAELINAKQKPNTAMEFMIGVLAGAGKKLAIENPKYLSAVTGKSPEEIKQMLIEDSEESEKNNTESGKSDSNASFTEVAANEYEGFEPEHAEQIKIAHAFLKRLNKEYFQLVYNILAFCNLPDGSINKANAELLIEFIQTKIASKN